jgi:hypothetical protein
VQEEHVKVAIAHMSNNDSREALGIQVLARGYEIVREP